MARFTKRKSVVVLCIDFPLDAIPERYLHLQDVDMPHPVHKLPRAVIWEDGRLYLVHKVMAIDARAAERCGGAGYRFIVKAGKKKEEREIWWGYDGNWFVEIQDEWSDEATDNAEEVRKWAYWATGKDLEKLVEAVTAA